jgi:mono/diheme cytochrome c family protein
MRKLNRAGSKLIVPAVAGMTMFMGGTSAWASDPQVEAGKKVFERNMCVNCHTNGENTLSPSKPLKGEKFQKKYKDDKVLEQVIRTGFPAEGMQPQSKDSINDKEMKELIAYVRTFTPAQPKPAK